MKSTTNQRSALNRQFVLSAKAIESWDAVRLRELWQLPPETPLDAIAELMARLHHLQPKTTERIEQALQASAVWPWLRSAEHLRGLPRILPAIYAYVSVADSQADAG